MLKNGGFYHIGTKPFVFALANNEKCNESDLCTGLKPPLEARRNEEQAGRGFGEDCLSVASSAAADSIFSSEGPSCWSGRPSLLPFLAVQERESPAGMPHQNKRAEGTKKIFVNLL
jgi:hypothetical protein